jgi:transposase, IS5 family
MRVDTTVVETDIHHPTDSTLLGDGVRVLTRIMRKITKIAGAAGTKLRDRSRSVKFRLLEIGRVARAKGPINQDKLSGATPSCWMQRAGLWVRQNAFPRKSAKA